MHTQTQQPVTAGTPASPLAGAWQTSLFLGVATLILGVIVSFHPAGSLNVVAVLLGVLMIISGIFHLSRMFDADEPHRIWLGIAGLLFIVAGVVLIRHLHLTKAIIGLLVGTVWIVQGVVSLVAGVSGGSRQGRAWWIVFGLLSIIAGIVVVAIPTSSLTFLAALLGIWFAVMGLLQIVGALMLRHSVKAATATP
jgi:uncharacterized membrane protein HdeD (DUF308 family)